MAPAVRPPLRLLRVANPVVRAVLGSPAHRLLSGRLLVLDYRGRRTGRGHRIPLRYAETEAGELVAVAVHPERKQWWRSFAEPSAATVLLRGASVDVVGALTSGNGRATALARYDVRNPRGARWTRDAAVVVFTLSR
jgi:hypothetical protein